TLYQKELEDAQQQLAQSELAISQSNQILSDLRKERENLVTKKSRLAEIVNNLENNRRNLQAWTEQARQSGEQIAKFQKLLSQKDLIESSYSQLQKTRQQVQEMDEKFRRISILTQNKHKLDLIISDAGKKLAGQQAVALQRVTDWEQSVSRLPDLHKQKQQLAIQFENLAVTEKQGLRIQEELKDIRSRISTTKAHQSHLTRSIREGDEKLKMLGQAEGALCPLCESELGADGQKRIEQKFLAEKNAQRSEFISTGKDLSQLEDQEKQLEKQFNQLDASVKKTRQELQTRHGKLEKDAADIEELVDKIKNEKIVLAQLELQLNQKEYAANEKNALAGVERELAAVQYDAATHESCRRQQQSLGNFETLWLQLTEAEKLISLEKEREAQALKSINEIKLQMELDSQREQSLTDELKSYGGVLNRLSQSEKEHQDLGRNQKRLQEILGGARTKLESLLEVEESMQKKNEQLKQAAGQAQIYKDLGLAFGKKGLQAMLIDMAIPEIEAEANLLLARMTDNRMFIKIETQRESKVGSIIETLDIKISDELGTRNYEMFSGGEAFRINFAIRIALSRLLARRAGAPLPTLIIDEGFGTQDGTGIEKIKEAITSIQDDFEKILVITHINDFKDAFPVRIEVVKTSEGSKVYLN
ncbi:MAG TPA: SMC family ATPase, partial [Dehalococcoidales bacterium]|nr:SMC family ATPase [Dehalococcoidales bacterium]